MFQCGFSVKFSIPYCCQSSPQPGVGDSWILRTTGREVRGETLAWVKPETQALLLAVGGCKFSM